VVVIGGSAGDEFEFANRFDGGVFGVGEDAGKKFEFDQASVAPTGWPRFGLYSVNRHYLIFSLIF